MTFLDRFEIQAILNQLNDELSVLQNKTTNGEEYTSDFEIINSIFDQTFQFGTCTNFILHTTLLMETDTEDVLADITKSVIPYDKVGSIEITWNPRTSEENASPPDELGDPDELLDKPWCYEVKIGQIRDLAIPVAECSFSSSLTVWGITRRLLTQGAVRAPSTSTSQDHHSGKVRPRVYRLPRRCRAQV